MWVKSEPHSLDFIDGSCLKTACGITTPDASLVEIIDIHLSIILCSRHQFVSIDLTKIYTISKHRICL